MDLLLWYWWCCSQLAGSSCSSTAFRPNYFTYLMYGHGLVGNGQPLLAWCQTWPFTLPPSPTADPSDAVGGNVGLETEREQMWKCFASPGQSLRALAHPAHGENQFCSSIIKSGLLYSSLCSRSHVQELLAWPVISTMSRTGNIPPLVAVAGFLWFASAEAT